MMLQRFLQGTIIVLLCAARAAVAQNEATNVIRVRYGYFPEARPVHTACARGWLDLYVPPEDTLYQVTCYPQTSGNFVASRLDNLQLDIGNLGSTPLAQALARGVDIKVVYINQYMGESQGIYVRPDEPEIGYTGIVTPFDLRGRKIGVPFGSTMHYQILFSLDLFSLTGEVDLINLSPTEIISSWDNRDIDGAGAWGTARDHLLHLNGGDYLIPPANTLMSSKILADWGRPTYTVVAATRTFADQHQDFMKHFVGILSRLGDSYLDRLGEKDSANIVRWDAQRNNSYLPSMVDALMKAGEVPAEPSQEVINSQRRALDDFVQQDAQEQISCDYLGPSPRQCTSPTLQHVAMQQTAEFLLDQKLIGRLGPLHDMGDDVDCQNLNTLCGGDLLDGSFMQLARKECQSCVPVGAYAELSSNVGNTLDGPDQLLLRLEALDADFDRSIFAPSEIGRAPAGRVSIGDSSCTNDTIINTGAPLTGKFGDGANAQPGLSYSDNLHCVWEIRAEDCFSPTANCRNVVEIQFEKLRVWSGDYIRVYSDPDNFECKPGGPNVLLAQLSGIYDNVEDIPPIRAVGCIMVVFDTDSNQERSYGDIDSLGDGFLASYNRHRSVCLDCNGFPCSPEGLCECDGEHWGGDCSLTKSCLGTSRVVLEAGVSKRLASSMDLEPGDFWTDALSETHALDPSFAYPNDLDCTFEISVPNWERLVEVEIYYDLEPSFDLLSLHSGLVRPTHDSSVYAVLTGTHNSLGESTGVPETYLVPTDDFGFVTMRLTTDSRGRRRGFFASVRAVEVGPDEPDECLIPGQSGYNCEVPHCVAENRLAKAVQPHRDVGPYALGRVVSQILALGVPAMPWAPDGGCIWPLAPNGLPPGVENIVALRLVFNSPLHLEPHPLAAVGDKLVIRTRREEDVRFFIEQCDSDEACSLEYQTGVCELGSCIVKTTFEIDVADIADATVRLVTDRNDGGITYSGLDFDALLVQECPTEDGMVHCEADGGQCIDGACYCEGGIPCTCPCDGESNVLSSPLKIGIVLGIVIPVFCIFLVGFLWYRRRKIRKSHAQKAIIAAKEAELEAFRNSVVGMRTAEKEYIPKLVGVEMPIRSGTVKVPPPTATAQWCWRETDHMMSKHDADAIFGDPTNCWIKYDVNSNANLEAAFQEQGGIGQFSPMEGYRVDFVSMIQTKPATGFQREVQRVVEDTDLQEPQDVDISSALIGQGLPEDLTGEPQIILVTGDVVQVSTLRDKDGWAFGTKLHHADEAFSRQLLSIATEGLVDDDVNIFTDTGWFPLEVTRVPSGEDLAALTTSVGDTGVLEPPSYWDPVADPTVVERHELREGDPERQQLVDAFTSTLTGKIKVLKVERIQNLAMWQTYVVKRQTICYRETGAQTGSDEINDVDAVQRRALERFERRWLWHGANFEVLDKILQQGFNRSFCGKNATIYGKGVYFARDAAYSTYKAYAVPDSRGRQYIMACRVVVGEYCKGQVDALTPDVRDTANNILYDSTVGLLSRDTMSNPSIYVTYHDAQAYPEYLITFKSS